MLASLSRGFRTHLGEAVDWKQKLHQQIHRQSRFVSTLRSSGGRKHCSTASLSYDDERSSCNVWPRNLLWRRKLSLTGGRAEAGKSGVLLEETASGVDPPTQDLKHPVPDLPYVWSKLTSETSIRLLQLKPAQNEDDDLICRLVEISLDQPSRPFEAVSYACGDFAPAVPLYMEQDVHVLITKNLAGALRTFRRVDQDRFLWVDTVCINQNDLIEKSQQVGMMHNIYRAATAVQVWLGEADEHTKLAFSTLQDLANERSSYGAEVALPFHHQVGGREEMKSRLRLRDNEDAGSAIHSLLNRDYFTRRWVVQEFALGRDLVINCGHHHLSWEVLSLAYGVIRTLRPEISTPRWMLRVRYHMAWTVLSMRISKSFLDSGRDVGFSPRSLLHLLKANETSRCREDPDLIYALLGLAEDDFLKEGSIKDIMKPDYTRDIETTFHLLAYAYLFGARDTRILHHIKSYKTLPLSFAPDWRLVPTTVHLGGYGPVAFKAGIGTRRQTTQIESNAGLPVLLGWYVDEISMASCKTFQQPHPNPIAGACYRTMKWHSIYEKFKRSRQNSDGEGSYGFTGEDLTTAFARVLVADNRINATKRALGVDSSSEELTSMLNGLILRSQQHGFYTAVADSEHGAFDATRLLDELTKKAQEDDTQEEQNILKYLHAAAHVLGERSFIISNEGWIGVGPADCRAGDVVAVLAGTETPFVLRPVVGNADAMDTARDEIALMGKEIARKQLIDHQKSAGGAQEFHGSARIVGGWVGDIPTQFLLPVPDEKTDTYTVVGECYIHGIMDGEFMVFNERQRKFTLR